MAKWTKRKLFTVQFKDRPARALLWRKSVYKEWFHYAKLLQEEGSKIPKAFGDLSKFKSFETWWRDPAYGFELFCEPEVVAVRVIEGKGKKSDNEVDLRVRLDVDKELALHELKRIISKLGETAEYKSQARFQPSLPMKSLKPEKLEQAREAYIVSESSKNQTEALLKLAKLTEKKALKRYGGALPWKTRQEYKNSIEKPYPYIMFSEEQPNTDEGVDLTGGEVGGFGDWRLRALRVLSYHRKTVRDILGDMAVGVEFGINNHFPTIAEESDP